VINSEPSDSNSSLDTLGLNPDVYETDDSVDFDLEMLGVLKDDPELELELASEVEHEGLGELEFEEPEANRPRKKMRIENFNSDTSNASGDFEIIDLIKDSEKEEENPYKGEDPYLYY
jgi:hypothetical protein